MKIKRCSLDDAIHRYIIVSQRVSSKDLSFEDTKRDGKKQRFHPGEIEFRLEEFHTSNFACTIHFSPGSKDERYISRR